MKKFSMSTVAPVGKKNLSHKPEAEALVLGGGNEIVRQTEKRHNLAGLLVEAYREPFDLQSFKDFAASSYCDENPNFWVAVSKYQKEDDCNRKKLGNEIYNKYVSDTAPAQINMLSKDKTKIESAIPQEWRADLFNDAQNAIYKDILKDTWPRFVKTAVGNLDKNDKLNQFGQRQAMVVINTVTLIVLMSYCIYSDHTNASHEWYTYRLISFAPSVVALSQILQLRHNV